jgi:hypothetical protein
MRNPQEGSFPGTDHKKSFDIAAAEGGERVGLDRGGGFFSDSIPQSDLGKGPGGANQDPGNSGPGSGVS